MDPELHPPVTYLATYGSDHIDRRGVRNWQICIFFKWVGPHQLVPPVIEMGLSRASTVRPTFLLSHFFNLMSLGARDEAGASCQIILEVSSVNSRFYIDRCVFVRIKVVCNCTFEFERMLACGM